MTANREYTQILHGRIPSDNYCLLDDMEAVGGVPVGGVPMGGVAVEEA